MKVYRHIGKQNAPELQMHDPLHAILRYIVVVEERVRHARDTEEQDAGCGEEEGAEVGSLGGLGDGGMDGDQGCFLVRLVVDLFGYGWGVLRKFWRSDQDAFLTSNCPSTVRHGYHLFGWCWRDAFGARVFFLNLASVLEALTFKFTGLELPVVIELVTSTGEARLRRIATMPKTKKSSGKPSAKPTASNASSTSPMDPPFKPAPAELSAFLDTLISKSHIYLLHLDTHPRVFKRRIFVVPLLLNIFILVVLVFRLQRALPAYFFLLLSILGYESPANIDKEHTNQMALLGIGGERTLMFAGDFLLFRLVGMWPWEFFLGKGGEASPVGWRRWCGFRDVEVVVRRSRRWDVPLFVKEGSGDGNMRGEVEKRDWVKEEWLQEGRQGKLFSERVLPAVDKGWVKNKTSYQMLDQNWDLYFSGMIEAQALIDQGKNKTGDFRTSVLVHTEKWGWLVWEVWREQEEGAEDEGTIKLRLIKDSLTVMGKENLFFRWIEIVQSETSQTGPFTAERYVHFGPVFTNLYLPQRRRDTDLKPSIGRRRRCRRSGRSLKNRVSNSRSFGQKLGE